MHNHNTEECHFHLMDTVARTAEDMELFERLAELESQALEEGRMMYEIPEAVAILASIGLEYER
jgi:hypothetical protein